MKNSILAAVASYQDEILEFTRALVAVPTENPPGRSYHACMQVLAGKLGELGIEHRVYEVPAPAEAPDGESLPRYCLLGFHGTGSNTLYFHGHYDVVPAASPDQFNPTVRDGCLYGRGSSDMKSGLAAMIYAVKALKDCGVKLGGRIGLVLVPDEETGGVFGSQYLAGQGLLGVDGIGMLLPEPTSGVIWNANRGALSLRVTIKGKPAHVGLHYQGVNAFEHMLVVANALLELKAELEQRQTAFQIEPEAARRSILLLGGQVSGGSNFNLVPAQCSFTVDRRINPEEDYAVEKGRLLALFERLRGEGIALEVEILQEGASAGVPVDDPLAQALAESAASVLGRRPAFELCPGLLELRFYTRLGVPAFAYGPGLLEVSHGPQEYVRLQDVFDTSAIYALTAARRLGASSQPAEEDWP